jgi:predicted ATP-grasp superfamily ATP-dependent carboligase
LKKESKNGVLIIEGHVQGLANLRSLGELGIPVYIVDKNNCIARYSKYCKKFFRCPDYIEDAFADFLIGLAEREGIRDWILIPSNDHAVFTISKHKTRLEVFYKIISPDIHIIENIYDKCKLLDLAKEAGISIPQTYSVRSQDITKDQFEITYPVILKGRYGLSFYKKLGRKAFLAENEVQIKECLNRIDQNNELENTIIQELIPYDGKNKTLSFTAFCVNGEVKTFWMGIKLREHPIRFGTATFAESIYIEECYVNSVILLKKLNYSGVCEIEYLKDPRDGLFKLIEMNARTWLWVGLAKKCGIDYPQYIYNHLHGIPINYPSQYDLRKKWINYLTDTIFSLKAILTGKLKVAEYLKSLKGDKIPAVFQKKDIIPGIMFLVLLPYIIVKRV